MKASEQLKLASYMNKRAMASRPDMNPGFIGLLPERAPANMPTTMGGVGEFAKNMLGDDAIERGANAFSLLPGVGFLGNAAAAGHNLMRGNFGRAGLDLLQGGASFATGGLSNIALKGGLGAMRAAGVAGRMSKALPTMNKAWEATKAVSRAPFNGVMNKGPMKAWGEFASKSPFKAIGVQAAAGIPLGSSALNRGQATMAGKDKAFDSVMNLGKATQGVSNMIGETGNPAFIRPPETGALDSTLAHL